MCDSASGDVSSSAGARRSQRSQFYVLASGPTSALGPELGSSRRASSSLKRWAISPPRAPNDEEREEEKIRQDPQLPHVSSFGAI